MSRCIILVEIVDVFVMLKIVWNIVVLFLLLWILVYGCMGVLLRFEN